jgi:hypothetical protein
MMNDTHSKRGIHNITREEFQRIHWRKFFTRKVIIIGSFAVIGFVLEHYTHLYFAGRGGEIAFGAVVEHFLFGIPLEG